MEQKRDWNSKLRNLFIAIVMSGLAVGLFLTSISAMAAPALPPGFVSEAVVAGLSSPTGMAWAPDGSGRVLLSAALRLHARLEREAMMVGQGGYFELWDSGVWSAKLTSALSGSSTPPPGMEDFSL